MSGCKWRTVAALWLLSCAPVAMAGEHGEKSWVRSYTHAYRDPANYPGRSVYAGSRYGFYGYTRPGAGTDPYPRTMRKVTPPTMYHWSKSAQQQGPSSAGPAEYQPPANRAYDYYAE